MSEEGYKKFSAAIPSLRYFQLQREGMGNESIVYSFMAIAQCSKVYQWGFDETSLNCLPWQGSAGALPHYRLVVLKKSCFCQLL
jgi:hypothetical protein